MMSALISLLQNLMMLWVSFTVLKIPHFFCECNQVVQHACYDTFLNDIVMYSSAGVLGRGPFIGIFYSYSKIVSSIRGVSAQGKYRAFSPVHLTFQLLPYFFFFFALFYGMLLGVYLSPADIHWLNLSLAASVMYTAVTPMLNPFIYSL